MKEKTTPVKAIDLKNDNQIKSDNYHEWKIKFINDENHENDNIAENDNFHENQPSNYKTTVTTKYENIV